jgi:hypothetical protein
MLADVAQMATAAALPGKRCQTALPTLTGLPTILVQH